MHYSALQHLQVADTVTVLAGTVTVTCEFTTVRLSQSALFELRSDGARQDVLQERADAYG